MNTTTALRRTRSKSGPVRLPHQVASRPDRALPDDEEMYRVVCERDASWEGVFLVGVKTTGIFCRPGCPARTPRRENVRFFASVNEALFAGFRPCRKCRPLEVSGEMPPWISRLMDEVERAPDEKWNDRRLREAGCSPEKLRRWFRRHHGMTFQAWLRAQRMSLAMGQMSTGRSVTETALDNGYDSLSGFREAFEKWCGQPPGDIRKLDNGALPIVFNRIPTPLGPMVTGVADDGLYLLEFADRRMLETQLQRLARRTRRQMVAGRHALQQLVSRQLEEYFARARREFDIPLQWPGSEFQRRVWQQLRQIPYGETVSYEQLAARIGSPGACRAVGRANGDNRLAIIIPCHRVIRADGTLSGYGGGRWRKQRLLDLEAGTGTKR